MIPSKELLKVVQLRGDVLLGWKTPGSLTQVWSSGLKWRGTSGTQGAAGRGGEVWDALESTVSAAVTTPAPISIKQPCRELLPSL